MKTILIFLLMFALVGCNSDDQAKNALASVPGPSKLKTFKALELVPKETEKKEVDKEKGNTDKNGQPIKEFAPVPGPSTKKTFSALAIFPKQKNQKEEISK